MCAETSAHVHWVPLDAKPGERVDSVSSPAPRPHEAIRVAGLARVGGLDGKLVLGFWSLGMREHILPKGFYFVDGLKMRLIGGAATAVNPRGGEKRTNGMGGGKGSFCACREMPGRHPPANENPRSGMLPLGDGWLRGSGDENASQKGV